MIKLDTRLKQLSYGDFICYIFDNMNDYRSIACNFIIDGLQNNDKILFVVDEYPKELLIQDLKNENIDVEQYINSGQLVIASNKNMYSGKYGFDVEATIENWKSTLKSIGDEGFNSFRAAGEMLFASQGDQKTIEKLMEYELRVHKEMLKVNNKQLNLCIFNRNKFSPVILGDMIEKHNVIIDNRQIIKPNPYFLDYAAKDECYSRRIELRQAFSLDLNSYDYKEDLEKKERSKDIEILKHVLGVTGEGVWELNFDTFQIDLSQNFYTILGYDKTRHIRTYNKLLELIHVDDVEGLNNEIQQFCNNQKENLVSQIRVRNEAGDWIWLLVKGVPIIRDATNGKVLKLVGIFNDITYIKKIEGENIKKKEIEIENHERIQTQQRLIIQSETEKRQALEEAIKLKDEFFYLITHEFKTPMAVINSALQVIDLMYRNEVTENVNKHLKTTAENTNRQLRLVNNLLDITKINSGSIKLNLGRFDIVYVTKSIVDSVEVYAKQKGINISFNPSILNKQILLDEEKYERILLNLLANSLKFTERGKSIDVSIDTRKYKGRDMVCISVNDEGIGIPKDKLNAIFERFGQVDTSLSRQAEGTGLGLHLVKLFVTTLNGEITVDSEVNKGTTFTVMFPQTEPLALDETAACAETYSPLAPINERLTQALSTEFSDIYF